MKKTKGITLIALVITIIVLLILAGISINMLAGENGLLTKTSEAKEKTDEANAREKLELSLYSAAVQKYTTTEYNEKEWLNKHVVEENPQEEIKIDEDIFVVNDWGFLVDRSIPKIVENLGKITLKPKKPKIEILEGEKLENDWYTSNIKVKIQGTGYKIDEEDVILASGSKEIEITEDGIYEFTAYVKGETQEEYEEVKLTIKRDTTDPENFTPIDGMGNGTGKQLQITSKANDLSGIIEYRYYLNNNYIATSNNENYTITGLEPFRDYTLYVIAKDNVGREKQSATIKFDTGVYLYNRGNECTNVTGGWQKIFKSTNRTVKVAKNSAYYFVRESNFLDFAINGEGTTTQYTENCCGGAIGITNNIKIDNYKYMCANLAVGLANYSGDSALSMCMNSNNSGYVGGVDAQGVALESVVCYTRGYDSPRDFSWDIGSIKGMYRPAIYLQSHENAGSWTAIYAVWLLK